MDVNISPNAEVIRVEHGRIVIRMKDDDGGLLYYGMYPRFPPMRVKYTPHDDLRQDKETSLAHSLRTSEDVFSKEVSENAGFENLSDEELIRNPRVRCLLESAIKRTQDMLIKEEGTLP